MKRCFTKPNFLFVFVLTFLALCQIVTAQTQMKFEQLNTNHGITEGHILSILRDSKGYLWIGTFNGLHRYNGYEFEVFTSVDSVGLLNSTIYDIFEDSNGKLWFATNFGLSTYEVETGMFRTFVNNKNDVNSLNNNMIRQIEEDENQHLWIATYGGGVNMLNVENESFEAFLPEKLNPTSAANKINTIYFDLSNRLWLGTDGGGLALMLPDNSFQFFRRNPNDTNSISSDTISGIFQDQKRNLWISTWYGGLNKFDENDMIFKHFNNTNTPLLKHNTITNMFPVLNKFLWLPTFSDGLLKFDLRTEEFSCIENEPNNKTSLASNTLWSVNYDYEKILWVGTFGSGISKFDIFQNKFSVFDVNCKEGALSSNLTETAIQTSNGKIIIGTKNGIEYFDNQSYTFSKNFPSNKLKEMPVNFIMEDKNENLWFCGYGILKTDINGENEVFYPLKKNIEGKPAGSAIYTSIQDKNNNYWFGGFSSGLIFLSKNEADKNDAATANFVYYTADKTKNNWLTNNTIWALMEDNIGRIWIANSDNTIFFEPDKQQFSSPVIPFMSFSLFQDSEGIIWAGTKNGLVKLNPQTFEWNIFAFNENSANNIIYGIEEDNNQNLWCTSSVGLFCFSKKQLEFVAYDITDGLPTNTLNFGHLKLQSGELLFTTNSGIIFFNPNNLECNYHIPNIVVTNIIINGNSVLQPFKDSTLYNYHKALLEKTLTLQPNEKNITLHFSALSFSSTEKIKYRYKLENFSEQWVDIDNQHFVTFTNLYPGEYILHIQAQNRDGIWTKNDFTLKIIVLPAWWQQTWFRIYIFTIIITCLYLFYHHRVAEHNKREFRLQELVQSRTYQLQIANKNLADSKEEIEAQRDKIVAQNAELEIKNKRMAQRNQQLLQLGELGKKITATFDIEKITHELFHFFKSYETIAGFGIGIQDDSLDHLTIFGFFNEKETLQKITFPLSDTKNVAVNSFSGDKDLLNKKCNNIPRINNISEDIEYNNVCSFLLKPKEKAIGVILIVTIPDFELTQNEIFEIKSLVPYISISIENALVYKIVNSQNEFIKSGIRYAQTIQSTILPIVKNMETIFPNFVIYKPKDIVSGDFYWYRKIEQNNRTLYYFAVIDCTGHGVPGALLSIMGYRLLNEALIMHNITQPSKIFEYLNQSLIYELQQKKNNNRDGMDITLCSIEYTENDNINVVFSGAGLPIYFFRKNMNSVEKIKGSRKKIGGILSINSDLEYTDTYFNLNKGDIIYLASDGWVDQCNQNRKRIGSEAFMNVIQKNALLPIQQQQLAFDSTLKDFQETTPQRDDITIWGIEL